MNLKLEIEYPETLPDVLQETRKEFEDEAKLAMAVKLFELKRISSGMAAQLCGLTRKDFLLKLYQYGVSIINMDKEEIPDDFKVLLE